MDIVKKTIEDATMDFYKSISSIEEKFTEQLRDSYKGKKVKIICGDSLIGGGTYYFDKEILDIKILFLNCDRFYFNIYVTVNYKSWIPGSVEKPSTFILREIE